MPSPGGSRAAPCSTGGRRRWCSATSRPGFRCALHHKDLGILTSAARDAGVTIPLGAAAAQLMGALVAQGHGDLDNTALLRLVEELSGRGH